MTDPVKQYLASIGKKGGEAKSLAKTLAARKNAKGRPKGSKNKPKPSA